MNLWKLPAIVIPPDVIFHIGGFPVTNTLLATWVTILILVAVFFFATRNKSLTPTRFQSAIEMLVDYMRGLTINVAGEKLGRRFFPLVATFFIFIMFANLLDVLPGVDTIGWINQSGVNSVASNAANCQPFLGFLPNCQPVAGFLLFGNISNQLVPWFRPATSDLNLTFAMALVSVITCQVFGFATLGAGTHLNKYFNVKALAKLSFQGFIEFFVGIVELISEISRILSFAFRLFGNIFAGGAVLTVFAFILPFVSGVIFIPLELFVAVVQALVFALLTLVFLQIATSSHETDDEAEHEAMSEFEHAEAARGARGAAAH